jgi:hypothetical protein
MKLIFALSLALSVTAVAVEPLRYNRDIRPILSDNCFACHGPDKANRKSGLRLDQREAALAPAESGDAAIVPGDLKKSALIERIFTGDADDIMPPPKSHKKLTTAQKETLKRWIAEGAKYEKHWSFMPVQTVKVPGAADLPKADAELLRWPRNPIDWFVLQKLAERGLKPSPRAETSTLARRMALDLTGLPPRPELLKGFDAAKPDAYITALFASPHYGERMAVDWLDAARFADTQGYQNDRDQDMHPFRDWVIGAFNRNMRFDQFTIEQIAGDLLPGATLEQKIATGFQRSHRINTEGGVIPAEYVAEYTADRVETTAAVWLGQTFNCARCHDHKFDPFTQQDFYSMKAFYNNVGEQGDGGLDTVNLPSADSGKKIAPLQREIAVIEEKLAKQKTSEAEVRAWADRLVKRRLAWEPLAISKLAVPKGKPMIASDARGFELAPIKAGAQPVVASVKVRAGTKITALRIECASEVDETRVELGRVQVQLPQVQPLMLKGAVEGVSLKSVDAERLARAERAEVAAKPPAKPKGKRKGVPPAPDAPPATLSPGPNQPPEALVFELAEPFEAKGGDETLNVSILIKSNAKETDWRVLFTSAPVDQLVPETVLEIAEKEPAKLTRDEQAALRKEFQLLRPDAKELRERISELNNSIAEARTKQDSAIVMSERKPKDTFILMRGEYNKPGEKVAAATPGILPPLAKDAPPNRLGLARWLVSTENPLTARVTVNRLWQSVFGTGLVRTSEDFGAQGEAPSHPELLDWLAGEFMRSGWDVQHVLRLMLTSATYQQTSRVTPELLAVDPDNRLLARGPRFRINAEFVRDQALAAAGLLSEKIGGKSVKPYHPPGIYEMVTVGKGTNQWVQDRGENTYRRSLYTYWKRTVPHPAMIAFDAPGREICAVRRSRSNTPLQALNLMNDPTYVEAARHLAARMIRSSPRLADQIQFGYRTLLARDAKPAEVVVLTRAFERARTQFTANADAATGLLKTGEPAPAQQTLDPAVLAAMTNVASTLLCLDETITKE